MNKSNKAYVRYLMEINGEQFWKKETMLVNLHFCDYIEVFRAKEKSLIESAPNYIKETLEIRFPNDEIYTFN